MILTVTLNAAIDKRYVVENYQVGEVNRVKECAYVPGGKGLNVSKTARIAGAQVLATGFVGGHAGEYILEGVEAQGVQTDFVKVPGESRSCINIFDSVNRTQTEFLEPGVVVSPESQQELLEKFETLLPKCSVVVASGSVPKGVGTDMYPKLVELARAAGKKIIVDTSGALLEEVVKAKPNMVKPNIDEIRLLTGKHIESREDLIEAGIALQKNGIERVVISLGGDGSLMFVEDGVYQAIVPKIDAVNTVGCGDCMSAGFAISFERGMTNEEALRFASATSAASAMREETGFFVKEDMEKLYGQVEIKKLR
jgi:tagatose 6-phosphate kinase